MTLNGYAAGIERYGATLEQTGEILLRAGASSIIRVRSFAASSNAANKALNGFNTHISLCTDILRCNGYKCRESRPTSQSWKFCVKLPQNISPIDLFISSSMSEEDPTALELRNMLRVLGARYDLFNYTFIDDRASPGGPNNEMDRRIQVCDAVIMIIHDHDGEEVRKGILKEYGLAVEYSKPLFMFTHVNFRATDHRRALIDQMRNKKALYEAQFSSNINLVDKLEFTLFDYMMQVLRQELIKSGRDAEDKLSSYELTSEIPGVRS